MRGSITAPATQQPRLDAVQDPSGTGPDATLSQSSAPSSQSLSRRWAWLAVAVITAGGLGLRLFAIAHGLPEQYVPDESTMVGGALRMGASRGLQPGTFIYPAGLMYLFAAEYLGLLGFGLFTHLFSSVDQFKEFAFVDPTLFYLLPRIAVALAGSACVPAVFMLGRRLYGNVAGVAAAFLVATSVMNVQMSHQARHWVPIALFTLAVLWVALDLTEHGRRRDYLLSGVLVGLAFATSFNGVLLLLIPIVAHLVRLRRVISHQSSVYGLRSHLPLLATVALAPIIFFALNPYILLHLKEFAAFQSSGERSIGGQILGHYDSYLQQFLARQGFGFFAEATLAYEAAITVLGLIGAVIAARRFPATALVVLAYPAFHYLMFATTAPSMEQRYMLPAVVLLALPAGLAVSRIVAWSTAGGRGTSARVSMAALLVVAVLTLLPALRYDWLLAQPDTRTLAKEWIERSIPAGSDIAVESYGPPLAPDLDTLRAQQQAQPGSLGNRDQWVLEKGLPAGEVAYRLTRLNLVDTSPSVDSVTPYILEHPHRYIVVSDFRWKSDHLGHQGLKTYLARNGRLVKAFYPSADDSYVPSDMLNNMEDPLFELFKVGRPGPRIEVYEVAP